MLTHGWGNTCNPISILYIPFYLKLQVLLYEEGNYQVELLCKVLVDKI